MKFILICFVFLKISCSNISLNESLIRHWSLDYQKQESYEAPYISVFSKNDKQLIFVAADHENSMDSKTFKTIEQVILKEKPDFLILEGFQNNEEVSPQWYIDYANKCSTSRFRKCGEPSYAAFIANQKNIPFAGGEIKDTMILKGLNEIGFQEIDVVGFYLLRMIPQLKKQKKIDITNQISQISKYLTRFSNNLNTPNIVTFNQFKEWYELHSSLKRSYLDLGSMDVAPINGSAGTYFQKISAHIGMIRERYLVQLIDKSLKKYNKVLVIYGAGHLVKSRRVYENTFGSSVDTKLY